VVVASAHDAIEDATWKISGGSSELGYNERAAYTSGIGKAKSRSVVVGFKKHRSLVLLN